MKRLFDYNAKLIQALTALTQLLLLNLLFCLCCLPLVTGGCALAGLCAGVRSVSENLGNPLQTFWQAARKDLRRAVSGWVLLLVCAGLLFFDAFYYYAAAYHLSLSILVLLCVAFFVVWAVGLLFFYLLPLTSGSLRQRVRLSFSTALSHPVRALAVCLLWGVFPGLFLFYPPLFLGLFPFWLLFYFSGAAWLTHKLFRGVLAQMGL